MGGRSDFGGCVVVPSVFASSRFASGACVGVRCSAGGGDDAPSGADCGFAASSLSLRAAVFFRPRPPPRLRRDERDLLLPRGFSSCPDCSPSTSCDLFAVAVSGSVGFSLSGVSLPSLAGLGMVEAEAVFGVCSPAGFSLSGVADAGPGLGFPGVAAPEAPGAGPDLASVSVRSGSGPPRASWRCGALFAPESAAGAGGLGAV